jgi:hypothetical protein
MNSPPSKGAVILWHEIHPDKVDEHIQSFSDIVYHIAYEERRVIASGVTIEFGIDCVPRHLIIDRVNIESAVSTHIRSIIGHEVSRFEKTARFCNAMVHHRGVVLSTPGTHPPAETFANAWVSWAILVADSRIVLKLMPSGYQRKIARIMASRHLSISEVSALAQLTSEAYGQGSFPRLRHFWLYGIGT